MERGRSFAESSNQLIVFIRDHVDTRPVRGEFASGFNGVAAAVEIGVVVSNEMQYGGLNSSLALQSMNAESRMCVKLLLLALGQGWGRDVRTKDIRGQL